MQQPDPSAAAVSRSMLPPAGPGGSGTTALASGCCNGGGEGQGAQRHPCTREWEEEAQAASAPAGQEAQEQQMWPNAGCHESTRQPQPRCATGCSTSSPSTEPPNGPSPAAAALRHAGRHPSARTQGFGTRGRCSGRAGRSRQDPGLAQGSSQWSRRRHQRLAYLGGLAGWLDPSGG